MPIDCYVLYTSQTGNCEQISEDLLETLTSDGYDGKFKSLKRLKLNEFVDKSK